MSFWTDKVLKTDGLTGWQLATLVIMFTIDVVALLDWFGVF